MSLNDFDLLQQLENEEKYLLLKVKNKKDGHIYLLKNIQLKSINLKEKKNMINEIKILNSLRHPNIIGFKNVFLDKPSNSFNILMEFPTNGNLENKIQYAINYKMYIEEAIIWNILTQILEGLVYAHKKGIIHKNLKSKNIYLTKFRLAKIINFGETSSLNNNIASSSKLRDLAYVAPEILAQKKYNYKCDIWSLGCIIYEMASLYLPFSGDNIESLYKNIMLTKYKSIPEFYSNNLKNIINNMLIVDPSKRPSYNFLLNFPNIKETRIELNKLNCIYINFNNNILLKDIQNKTNNNRIQSSKNFKKKEFKFLNINENKKSRTQTHSRNISKSNTLHKREISNENIKKEIRNSTYRTLKERNIYLQNSLRLLEQRRCNSKKNLNIGNYEKNKRDINIDNNIFNNYQNLTYSLSLNNANIRSLIMDKFKNNIYNLKKNRTNIISTKQKEKNKQINLNNIGEYNINPKLSKNSKFSYNNLNNSKYILNKMLIKSQKINDKKYDDKNKKLMNQKNNNIKNKKIINIKFNSNNILLNSFNSNKREYTNHFNLLNYYNTSNNNSNNTSNNNSNKLLIGENNIKAKKKLIDLNQNIKINLKGNQDKINKFKNIYFSTRNSISKNKSKITYFPKNSRNNENYIKNNKIIIQREYSLNNNKIYNLNDFSKNNNYVNLQNVENIKIPINKKIILDKKLVKPQNQHRKQPKIDKNLSPFVKKINNLNKNKNKNFYETISAND